MPRLSIEKRLKNAERKINALKVENAVLKAENAVLLDEINVWQRFASSRIKKIQALRVTSENLRRDLLEWSG